MSRSKIVDERLHVAKIILQNLSKKPLRWSELGKLTIKASPTLTRFQLTLPWLLQNGYITKVRRGLYMITDKGKIFLEALMLEE